MRTVLNYPPHPTETRYPFISHREWLMITGELERPDKDIFLYGVGGVHISEDGDIERLPPMTIEEKIRRMNESRGSYTEVKMMRRDEIIARFPNTSFLL